MVMLLGMAGLIIDGGAVFAQQRIAQNGADGSANAGAIVLAQWVTDQAGPMQDAQVNAAVQDIAGRNELIGATAVYTNNLGEPIPGATVGVGPKHSKRSARRKGCRKPYSEWHVLQGAGR